MSFGILLIHGYSGSPQSLKPLFDSLCKDYQHVENICLPGHHDSDAPPFNEKQFLDKISNAIEKFLKSGKEIIFIGHSTGGSLILRYLQEYAFNPLALILISTPKKITADYMQRWEAHRSGNNMPLLDIARMVSSINKAGRSHHKYDFPVLFINGEADNLVTPNEIKLWVDEKITDNVHAVIVPFADHDMFYGRKSNLVIDTIKSFLSDITHINKEIDYTEEKRLLVQAEPLMERFISNSPHTLKHLINCPSGQKIIQNKPVAEPIAINAPTFANIEVTTFCNLKCKFCARTHFKRSDLHMNKNTFSRILDLLPHVFNVTLVGLGEPLLHPDIIEIISEASSRNKKVSLVTNGMNLDKTLSSNLIKSGLDTIIFSIDAANQELASQVRAGSHLDAILVNINNFNKIAKESPKKIAKAVFSSLSEKTIPYASELIELVAQLDVDAIMLTDLNFRENIAQTLWKNKDTNGLRLIRQAVGNAFSKRLPVLSVKGLEEFGIANRYKDFLLLPFGQICHRSKVHTNCYSPWQTIPVGVNGDITICDCQPEKRIGNLLDDPLTNIWNGNAMMNHRARMLSNFPPDACRICPRF
jgi:MoaA/NifB/PqqE/SkfB family radical SAM enzyme/alpha-beta hydrolase superfamily lysophospholipase